MAERYRNAYRDELDNEDDVDQVAQELENLPAPVDVEEETFKQRYGNLRRHSQKIEDDYKRKLAEKDQQIAALSKSEFKLPKTEAEVDEWAQQYPDVAAIVRTLAIKEAQNLQTSLDERLKKVEQDEKANRFKEALLKINQAHPDFDELRNDPEFHEWAQSPTTPKWIREALYENDEDAQIVIEAVDYYKIKKSAAKKESAPKDFDRKGAAASVSTSSGAPKQDNDSEAKWSDSRVAKLTDREYDKYEDEIMEAIRTGKYVYDLSGGAR